MSESIEMKTLADNLWTYFEPKVKAMMNSSVSYYRAKVVAAANNNVIQVQKPFDDTIISLPYVSSAANLTVGSQCTVMVFGSHSNAIILGDGKVSGL